MKALEATAVVVILTAFLGCGDGGTITTDGMDLEPPYGGYIWMVTNGGGGYVGKLNPVDGTWVEGYQTPFSSGHNYDAAAGDGRVWVAGEKIIDGLPDIFVWEVGGDCFEAPAWGLTWDGKYLLGGAGNRLYHIDPDTHESELLLTCEGARFGVGGLAWDGTYLWSLIKTRKVIFQLDPTTGDILHTIVLPEQIEGPRGLTWDGEALWVNDTENDVLYRVSPKDGSILGYRKMMPAEPYGLAFEFPIE